MTRRVKIETTRPSDLWNTDTLPHDLTHLCTLTLDHAAFDKSDAIDITLTLSDDVHVRELNKTHRGKDKPTNVLSFPAYDPSDPHPPGAVIHLGDVVLAYETVAREAEEQGKALADHATHLIVHGLLHLIGYDHEEDGEAEEMEALEIRILKGLGIKNPYQA